MTPTVEKFAWQRNADAGQGVGNLQENRPLDREAFDKGGSRIQAEGGTFELFSGWTDSPYASLLSKDNGETWRITKVLDNLADLRPAQYKFDLGWVIQVASFESPEAQAHIRSADRDPQVELWEAA